MHARRIAVALVAVAGLLASRPAGAVMTPNVNREGWTKDSSAFVLTLGFEDDDAEEWHVYAAADGKEMKVADEDALKAFLAAHPLADKGDSPDGLDATSDVVEGRTYRPGASVHGHVRRGGKDVSTTAIELSLNSAASVEGVVSPDGRHVAWVVSQEESHPTGQGDFDVNQDDHAVIAAIGGGGAAAGPRVMMVRKGVPDAAVAAATDALTKAGYAVARTDPGDDARDKTIVYAAKGFEADAQKIAAAIHGGATVQPLTWKPGYDLVVALGATAAK